MKRMVLASAALVGALAYLPVTAEAQRVGGSGGLGGGNFRSALGAGGVTGFGNSGFRGGGLAGGGFRGGGLAGRPGFGAGRPGFGHGFAGARPGYGYGNRGWYGGRGWRNAGWNRRGYGYGGVGLGLGLGLAAGGLYGAYGYPGYGYGYDDGYYAPAGYYGSQTVEIAPGGDDSDAVAECARRFKTYDPQTQTYIGKGYVRRSCP